MKAIELNEKLTALFDHTKLDGRQDAEWGFSGEPSIEVHRIGYATNFTPDTIREAIRLKADFILTHHDAWPFLFGMKAQCEKLLRENNIAHAFFHAPLDDADFGTSAALADALHLQNCVRDIPYSDCYLAGVVGELETPLPFAEFDALLESVLWEPVRAFQNHRHVIRSVCVVTGGGNLTTDMKLAVDRGCDAYVTGEYSLYSQQYAKFTGIDLFVGSHTNTEILGVERMVSLLTQDTALEAVRLPESND